MPTTTATPPSPTTQDHLLHVCRSLMPDIAGVVLTTPDGRVVAHETTRVHDPDALAAQALVQHAADGGIGASALVDRDDGTFLVVLVPASAGPAAIGAAAI